MSRDNKANSHKAAGDGFNFQQGELAQGGFNFQAPGQFVIPKLPTDFSATSAASTEGGQGGIPDVNPLTGEPIKKMTGGKAGLDPFGLSTRKGLNKSGKKGEEKKTEKKKPAPKIGSLKWLKNYHAKEIEINDTMNEKLDSLLNTKTGHNDQSKTAGIP